MKITKHTDPIPRKRRKKTQRTKYQRILDAMGDIKVGETIRVEFDNAEDRNKAGIALRTLAEGPRSWIRDYTIAGRENALYLTRDA